MAIRQSDKIQALGMHGRTSIHVKVSTDAEAHTPSNQGIVRRLEGWCQVSTFCPECTFTCVSSRRCKGITGLEDNQKEIAVCCGEPAQRVEESKHRFPTHFRLIALLATDNITTSGIFGSFPAVMPNICFTPPPSKSLSPKNKNPPPAEQFPPYFGFTGSAEVVTEKKKRKTAYLQKITAIRRRTSPLKEYHHL